jgi:gluconolactonase
LELQATGKPSRTNHPGQIAKGSSMSSDRLARIFPEPLVVETIAEGFATAEGPVWYRESGRLIFSDIGLVFDDKGITPRHMGRRYQFDPGTGEVTLLVEGTNRADGMVRDAQGRLLACEIEGHSVTRTDADGRREILANACDGVAFGVPNDLVVATNGRIYFTDSGKPPLAEARSAVAHPRDARVANETPAVANEAAVTERKK